MTETTARTRTLADFLLARYAEEEQVAQDLLAESQSYARNLDGPTRDEEYAGLNIGVGRVLLECAALRRIIWRAQTLHGPQGKRMSRDAHLALTATLKDLASLYVAHPDYREEWRA